MFNLNRLKGWGRWPWFKRRTWT